MESFKAQNLDNSSLIYYGVPTLVTLFLDPLSKFINFHRKQYAT